MQPCSFAASLTAGMHPFLSVVAGSLACHLDRCVEASAIRSPRWWQGLPAPHLVPQCVCRNRFAQLARASCPGRESSHYSLGPLPPTRSQVAVWSVRRSPYQAERMQVYTKLVVIAHPGGRTPPSRGRLAASRKPPLTSNVRPHEAHRKAHRARSASGRSLPRQRLRIALVCRSPVPPSGPEAVHGNDRCCYGWSAGRGPSCGLPTRKNVPVAALGRRARSVIATCSSSFE